MKKIFLIGVFTFICIAEPSQNPRFERVASQVNDPAQADKTIFEQITIENVGTTIEDLGPLLAFEVASLYYTNMKSKGREVNPYSLRLIHNNFLESYETEIKNFKGLGGTEWVGDAKLIAKVLVSISGKGKSIVGLDPGGKSAAIDAMGEVLAKFSKETIGKSLQYQAQNKFFERHNQMTKLVSGIYNVASKNPELANLYNNLVAYKTQAKIGVSAEENLKIASTFAQKKQVGEINERTLKVYRLVNEIHELELKSLKKTGHLGDKIDELRALTLQIQAETSLLPEILKALVPNEEEKRQKEFEKTVNGISNATSAVGVLLSAIDKETARVFVGTSGVAIETAKLINAFNVDTKAGLNILAATNLISGLILSANTLVSIFSNQPSFQEVVLNQLSSISKQIVELHAMVKTKMEDLDMAVAKVFNKVSEGFADIKVQIAAGRADLNQIKAILSGLSDKIDGVAYEVEVLFSSTNKIQMYQQIRECLDAKQTLNEEKFMQCLSNFNTYANLNSSSPSHSSSGILRIKPDASLVDAYLQARKNFPDGIWGGINYLLDFTSSYVHSIPQPEEGYRVVNPILWTEISSQLHLFLISNKQFVKLYPEQVAETVKSVSEPLQGLNEALNVLSTSKQLQITQDKVTSLKYVIPALQKAAFHYAELLGITFKSLEDNKIGQEQELLKRFSFDRFDVNQRIEKREVFNFNTERIFSCDGIVKHERATPQEFTLHHPSSGILEYIPNEIAWAVKWGLGTVRLCIENAGYTNFVDRREYRLSIDFDPVQLLGLTPLQSLNAEVQKEQQELRNRGKGFLNLTLEQARNIKDNSVLQKYVKLFDMVLGPGRVGITEGIGKTYVRPVSISDLEKSKLAHLFDVLIRQRGVGLGELSATHYSVFLTVAEYDALFEYANKNNLGLHQVRSRRGLWIEGTPTIVLNMYFIPSGEFKSSIGEGQYLISRPAINGPAYFPAQYKGFHEDDDRNPISWEDGDFRHRDAGASPLRDNLEKAWEFVRLKDFKENVHEAVNLTLRSQGVNKVRAGLETHWRKNRSKFISFVKRDGKVDVVENRVFSDLIANFSALDGSREYLQKLFYLILPKTFFTDDKLRGLLFGVNRIPMAKDLEDNILGIERENLKVKSLQAIKSLFAYIESLATKKVNEDHPVVREGVENMNNLSSWISLIIPPEDISMVLKKIQNKVEAL